ncbi:MAG: FlxA-like family protein [Lachnospiraceae bacterium]|nr:FlxA-like family protein [Lachnospiraceae bacterium]
MKINGLNGTNTQFGGMNMKATDSVGKNIQNRIANAQKQLQELSANTEMGIEEKLKKRQEIQQEITDLNNELRQHQIEERMKKQQTKSSSMNDMLGGSKKVAPKVGKKSAGISQGSMKAIISADTAMAQARVQGSTVSQMEGKAGVLETEIKLDAARGGNVEAKEKELTEIQQKVAVAQDAQLNTLSDANKKLEDAAKADQQAEKAEDKKSDKKTDKKDAVSEKKEDKNLAGIEEKEFFNIDVKTEITDIETANVSTVSESETATYNHVDVRL